ncbi:fungal pheromone STE3G-protein-coupled receptor, partial [Artomyces pyxidatus]
MPSYSNSAFSACSFIGFIVSIVPFYWHARGTNVGTCLFMFWSSLGCLNLFIDSCIWKGNTMDVAPVWCDISTRVLIAQNIGIPASILCITRRLYMLTDVSGGTSIDKRREAFIDLGIGLGLPILEIGMYYIVQGHRYNIFEDVGCRPIIINTVVAFGLVYTWPLVISAVSVAYGLCAIYRFTRHSRELRALLSVDKTNKGRNIRLILIAGADIFGSIPISIYNIYCDSTYISPWVSWRYLHSDFSQVEQIPASVWKANSDMYAGIEETQWVTVACAFVFFTLFGIFSQEAIGHYQ